MAWRTQYSKRQRLFSNHGDPIQIEYSGYYDDEGNVVLKEIGKTDLYSYIQSFADSVDINILLKKFANGDDSALNQRRNDYIDCTQFPKTYAEALNMVIEQTDYFNSLPNDIRQKFDNDVNKFIASTGTEDWLNKMNINTKHELDETINNITNNVQKNEQEEVQG